MNNRWWSGGEKENYLLSLGLVMACLAGLVHALTVSDFPDLTNVYIPLANDLKEFQFNGLAIRRLSYILVLVLTEMVLPVTYFQAALLINVASVLGTAGLLFYYLKQREITTRYCKLAVVGFMATSTVHMKLFYPIIDTWAMLCIFGAYVSYNYFRESQNIAFLPLSYLLFYLSIFSREPLISAFLLFIPELRSRQGKIWLAFLLFPIVVLFFLTQILFPNFVLSDTPYRLPDWGNLFDLAWLTYSLDVFGHYYFSPNRLVTLVTSLGFSLLPWFLALMVLRGSEMSDDNISVPALEDKLIIGWILLFIVMFVLFWPGPFDGRYWLPTLPFIISVVVDKLFKEQRLGKPLIKVFCIFLLVISYLTTLCRFIVRFLL